MDFGIAAEGVTDQIVIQNLLCGFFHEIEDLEEEITFVQPHQDATDVSDDRGYGSWTCLFSYLKDKRFREDVLNTEFLIVQVDSDVCNDVGFDVDRVDENNEEVSVDEIVERVVSRLIEKISEGNDQFYRNNKDKIIFSVCVDSIECWLYKYYEKDSRRIKIEKIKGCEASLEKTITKSYKKLSTYKGAKEYERLSKPLRRMREINKILDVDVSLRIFIDKLSSISYPD